MWKTFSTIFSSVFITEVGHKTQLATMLFSAEEPDKWLVSAGSASALVLASAVGVIGGAQIVAVIGLGTLLSR